MSSLTRSIISPLVLVLLAGSLVACDGGRDAEMAQKLAAAQAAANRAEKAADAAERAAARAANKGGAAFADEEGPIVEEDGVSDDGSDSTESAAVTSPAGPG